MKVDKTLECLVRAHCMGPLASLLSSLSLSTIIP